RSPVGMKINALACLVLAVATCAAGCAGSSSAGAPPLPACASGAAACASALGSPSSKIRHIVLVIQENRSFDNFFATFPGADGATWGLTHDGQRVALRPAKLVDPIDIGHSWLTYETEYDHGKMDGFDLIHFRGGIPAG